ncbi:hypothetical protein ACA910_012980 [Epithemia clementina (nom. ined.)]
MIRHHALATIWLFSIILLCLEICPSSSAEFDPYQLNGGLIAAVAGRDYCLIAVDTRLVGKTGYDILDRQHLQSRLWSATSDLSSSSSSSSKMTNLFTADGSLAFPTTTATSTTTTTESTPKPFSFQACSSVGTFDCPPVLIGSAGCQADCEFLKRSIRWEVQRSQLSGELVPVESTKEENEDEEVHDDHDMGGNHRGSLSTSPASSIAVLLSQVLYGRRFFPWYSFCVVAGLSMPAGNEHDDEGGGEGAAAAGQVFVYDAIGSYEAVAVATAGIGRELLQPILDRSFSTYTPTTTKVTPQETSKNPLGHNKNDDAMLFAENKNKNKRKEPSSLLMYDRNDVSGGAPCVVEQSAEEAAEILVQAFRAVSERQTTVGDHVVVCCIQRHTSPLTSLSSSSPITTSSRSNGSPAMTRVWAFSSPLKLH